MSSWQVQDAKARFSELLDTTLKHGPQVVTRRGVEAAVMVAMDEWRRLQSFARPSLKESLLSPAPRFDLPLKRGRFRRRRRVDFR
jgi:antitoxin Phd